MKVHILFILLLTALSLSACDSKDKNEKDSDNQSLAAKQMSNEPSPSSSPLERADTIRRGSSTYIISVARQTDKEVATVKDEFGTEFYDNRVTISIQKDGNALVSRSFRKSDFEAYLPSKDKQHSVFQGMAFIPETSSANTFHFGAQVGVPGLDGEGPAFTVVLDTNGGLSITRDLNQDTTLDDMKAEDNAEE